MNGVTKRSSNRGAHSSVPESEHVTLHTLGKLFVSGLLDLYLKHPVNSNNQVVDIYSLYL